jgi:hypothetical protein
LPATSGPLQRKVGHIAARPRQVVDEAAANGVDGNREDDRNGRCGPLRSRHRIATRDDDIHFARNECFGNLRCLFVVTLSPAIIDRNRSTWNPTELAQSLFKRGDLLAPYRLRGCSKETYERHLRLLGARRERPCRCATECCDKIASFHGMPSNPGRNLPQRCMRKVLCITANLVVDVHLR